MARDSPWLNCKAEIEQQLTLILLSDSSDHCYWSFLRYIFILLFISLNISSFRFSYLFPCIHPSASCCCLATKHQVTLMLGTSQT